VRWATFDCYVEPRIESETPGAPYREVLARGLAGVAESLGRELPDEEHDALGRSLPDWPVFPEVPAALEEARRRGWRLVILSNTDREFIEASMERIGVRFELAIVASEVGSYKPAHGHWREFLLQTGADPSRHVHVAASLFHDVEPCHEFGIPCVWINREAEAPRGEPAAELQNLSRLPETLDRVLPA
jgi:2-haloacid dehalogenase